MNVLVKQAAWESNANKDALFKLWAKSGLPYNAFVKANTGVDLKLHSAPCINQASISLIKQN